MRGRFREAAMQRLPGGKAPVRKQWSQPQRAALRTQALAMTATDNAHRIACHGEPRVSDEKEDRD